MKLRFIGFAAASGRVGMVYMEDGQLVCWKMSSLAATCPEAAAAYAAKLIARYTPDWVILEDAEQARCKGKRTKRLIAAMARVAQKSAANVMIVQRRQPFKNKYEEAEALTRKHPELSAIALKRRRVFDLEPRATVVFEAVALIETAQKRSVLDYPEAMGRKAL